MFGNVIGRLVFAAVSLQLAIGVPVTAEVRPIYPVSMTCGPITSLFGDLRDLDGRRRDVAHEGIDLGAFGNKIIAPADGQITAIWSVDHGWGRDWNLLITHSAVDLNLSNKDLAYYTEFDHLQKRDIRHLHVDQRLRRGDPIGIVRHPGNAKRFHAEVHMETYTVPRLALGRIEWRWTDGRQYWWNGAARLMNPLELFHPIRQQGKMLIPLYDGVTRYTGLSYPLDCGGEHP